MVRSMLTVAATTAWSHRVMKSNELLNNNWWDVINESTQWQDAIFFSLSAAYALVSVITLVQLLRIEWRVPEFGWTTQKVFHLINFIVNAVRAIVFGFHSQVYQPHPMVSLSKTMTTTSYSAAFNFPVIFFDGEQEIHIGNILVSPTTDHKTFQSHMSTKIGISHNQFTTFLKHQNHPHRKIPITQKLNFAALLQDTKYYFLVSLKRKKKDRFLKGNSTGFYDMRLTALHLEKERFWASLRWNNQNDVASLEGKQEHSSFKDVVCDGFVEPNCHEDHLAWYTTKWA